MNDSTVSLGEMTDHIDEIGTANRANLANLLEKSGWVPLKLVGTKERRTPIRRAKGQSNR